jgi:DNA-binding NarL/FixJ family response regulator
MELRPDVVVLDILMPALDGIQITRRLTAMRTKSRIVVLTGLEDQGYVKAALKGGAHAFVFKRRMASDLLQAINGAIDGRFFLSESVDAVYMRISEKVSDRKNAAPPSWITGTKNGG